MVLSWDGGIKLIDFGLARKLGKEAEKMTSAVCTRHYRPPEVIFGERSYDFGVDIWSLGCILAELYIRKPIFPGSTDIDQLSKIFEIRGTPEVKFF